MHFCNGNAPHECRTALTAGEAGLELVHIGKWSEASPEQASAYFRADQAEHPCPLPPFVRRAR